MLFKWANSMDMRTLLSRIGTHSQRPRYAFLVLNLIAKGADEHGECGPFIQHEGEAWLVRLWLLEMLHPILGRACRKPEAPAETAPHLDAGSSVPSGDGDASRRSGLTNISRAVSDLVRAGLITRYYAGYRVDHAHRGGQRHAVYVLSAGVREALSGVEPSDRLAA